MTRRITKMLVLSLLSLGGLVLAGCQSSSSQPHSLTGSDEMQERQRFTDSRGVYHPDWRRGINTPPGR